MRVSKLITALMLFILAGSMLAPWALSADKPAKEKAANAVAPIELSKLDALAKKRLTATARVALVAETSELFTGIENLEPPETHRVPNYLRAIAALPNATKPLAHLLKTVIYGGTLAPETKLSMGLRISQLTASPYVAAHLQRLLGGSARGQQMLTGIKANEAEAMSAADRLALRYAEALTQEVHGVSDEDFQKTRAYFNDSQIVELTMTVCFFNYFTRFCEALNLPVEEWALNTAAATSLAQNYAPPVARVALISDAQMQAASDVLAASKNTQAAASGLGLGIANSQRAMLRVPDISAAWRAFGTAARDYAEVSREIKLHVSFAVSMANGCRYCTLHQVLGLRRLKVDPAKLMAMKKDDAALSARELAAVTFARQLTRAPATISDGDYEKLKAEFKEQGALEVLLQTCNFAFMNRFTDGLRLPSEDEAIRVYKEVYGAEWK
ncbi:MAG: carboxymuconolactone decarboxylase family protein [Acidobacteria bacterium]|nr:carboxymuconolactone decarboxylase family protein [Acidobacteriota bacterium]